LSILLSPGELDGHRFDHLSPGSVDPVQVDLSLGGEVVGKATFHAYGEGWGSFAEICIVPSRRRQGLATRAYDAMESLGITIVPSETRSRLGEAFWQDRNSRSAPTAVAA
jgi:hypothetical protein